MDIPWISTLWIMCVSVQYSISTCTSLTTAPKSVPLVVTQCTLDEGRNGSHSIICKGTSCLFTLFLPNSLYLYLNVFGNPRTNVQDAVKWTAWYPLLHDIKHSSKTKEKKNHVFKVFSAFVRCGFLYLPNMHML